MTERALPFDMVSADSHVIEPPDLWTTRLPTKFRDRAPTFVSKEDSDYWTIDGRISEDSAVGLFCTKRKYGDPQARFTTKGRWADVPVAAYDSSEMIKDMDREGLEALMVYTTLGLNLYQVKDRDYRYACFQAFNDWLADYCSGDRKRLFGVAMIPHDETERALAEMERCAKKGLRGAMIGVNSSSESYTSDGANKLWAAAAEMDMPVSLHVAATDEKFVGGNMFVEMSLVFTTTMFALTSMIFTGVFDRHPKLKVISVENDASWPLPMLERADDRWYHDQFWVKDVGGELPLTSGRKPSEIFHDQIACTFLRDRTAILSREIIGRRNLMWGADFPHFDGAWPNSAQVLARQFGGVPLEDQLRIGRNNVIDWYNLPLRKLTPADCGVEPQRKSAV